VLPQCALPLFAVSFGVALSDTPNDGAGTMANSRKCTFECADCSPRPGSARFDYEIHNQIAAELAFEMCHGVECGVCQIVSGFAPKREPFESPPTQKSGRAKLAMDGIDRGADSMRNRMVSEKNNLRGD
jgi:hypothetical protein